MLFLHPKGIDFTGLAIFPNLVSSFIISSLGTKGGTLERVILVAGADNGVTETKVSFTQIPFTVNSLTSASLSKTPLPPCSYVTQKQYCQSYLSPTTKSTSSTITPGSGTHLHPFRSDNGGDPWTKGDAIPANHAKRRVFKNKVQSPNLKFY